MRHLAHSLALLLLASPAAAQHEHGAQRRNVAILVYEGVELLDFAGPGEVFSAVHVGDGMPLRVFTVATSREPVLSQRFVTVTPQYTLADCPAPDIVVVPGGSVPWRDESLQEWVRACAESGELVMSVCNGALLLAEAGLLDGLEATTHHSTFDTLTNRYPDTRVLVNRRFVDSGGIMTCAGVSAGIDGALHVVERMYGDDAARRTARYMEYDWRPEEIAAELAQPGRTTADSPLARLAARALADGVDAALAHARSQGEVPDEAELNRAAYGLLNGRKPREARALFELVVAAYPGSANARDSLSEACERLGDAEAAKAHAREALALLDVDVHLDERRAASIRNHSASRLVRLGEGDPATLRFGCEPCGRPCDDLRYVEQGRCPGCGMGMELVNGD